MVHAYLAIPARVANACTGVTPAVGPAMDSVAVFLQWQHTVRENRSAPATIARGRRWQLKDQAVAAMGDAHSRMVFTCDPALKASRGSYCRCAGTR